MFFFNFTSQALQSRESTEDEFEIRADGTVRVDGYEFKNLSEYVRSDYFRRMGKRCGTKVPYGIEEIQASTLDCTISQTIIQSEYYLSQTITIPLVFHIIHKTDGTGNISDQRITDQVAVLNEDYRAMAGSMGANGYDTMKQFTLESITRTADDNWHNDNDELGYKTALGWDQNNYYNVYINTASGYLGYAYFPQTHAGTVYDGCTILYEAVGGRNNGYSFIRSRTHISP